MRNAIVQALRNPWIENWLLIPGIVAIASCAAWWAMIYDRIPPIVLYDGRIEPQRVTTFGFVTARWRVDVVSSGAWSATVNRDIRDYAGTWYRVDQQDVKDANVPDGAMLARTTQVPRAAAWGPAEYYLSACYRKNGFSLTPIWPVCVQWPALSFEIVPSGTAQ